MKNKVAARIRRDKKGWLGRMLANIQRSYSKPSAVRRAEGKKNKEMRRVLAAGQR